MENPVIKGQSKRGPKAHRENVKEEILCAARDVFAQKGFQGATIRAIAQEADVDSKLVHYYFGTKSELFSQCIIGFFERNDIFTEVKKLLFEPSGSGAGYVRAVLNAFEHSESGFGAVFLGMLHGIGSHQESMELFQRFVSNELVARIQKWGGGDQFIERAALIATQMYGLVLARYILGNPVIAEKSIDELAELIGPVIDHYRSL